MWFSLQCEVILTFSFSYAKLRMLLVYAKWSVFLQTFSWICLQEDAQAWCLEGRTGWLPTPGKVPRPATRLCPQVLSPCMDCSMVAQATRSCFQHLVGHNTNYTIVDRVASKWKDLLWQTLPFFLFGGVFSILATSNALLNPHNILSGFTHCSTSNCASI